MCSNSPSEASSARGTDISAAEAATDSDDDDHIVAEVISEDESEEAATPKPKPETLQAARARRQRVAARRAAEKEKKEKEEAEKAKKRRPVPGPGATMATTKTTATTTTTPASKKSAEKPPPSLKKLFEEEKDFPEWNAVEGVKWATMGVAQLREEFAHRDHKKHRENASKFSAALDKKRRPRRGSGPRLLTATSPRSTHKMRRKSFWRRGPRRQGSKKTRQEQPSAQRPPVSVRGSRGGSQVHGGLRLT